MAETTKKKLNVIAVASLYIGVIMGAGFSSGRESWQFFGIFGKQAIWGAMFTFVGFVALSYMIGYLSLKLETDDMGRLISFVDKKIITDFLGSTISGVLFTIIISMTAAGGSLLNQQFGIHRAIGGAIIAGLVMITILGDFERVSKWFKYLVPILLVIVVTCGIMVLFSEFKQSGKTSGFKIGGTIPNWMVGAPVYLAYNFLGMVPIGASASINAKNKKTALWGSVLGGLALGSISLLMVLALQKDMAYSDSLDLPMLGYAGRISPIVNLIYGVILYFAIYSSATSVFYGFTSKLPKNKHKNKIIIASIIVGYLMGLVGFKNIVAYLYPIEGYISVVVVIMFVINFIKVFANDKLKNKKLLR